MFPTACWIVGGTADRGKEFAVYLDERAADETRLLQHEGYGVGNSGYGDQEVRAEGQF